LLPAIQWGRPGGSKEAKVNRELLKRELRRDEGLRLKVYPDSKGYATIGYGHQNSNLRTNARCSLAQAEQWLATDIESAIEVARLYLDPIDLNSLSENRQRALVNMCFNLGYHIKEFKKMKAAIVKSDWQLAAMEALDSQWRIDVGEGRSQRITDMLEQG
jgi:lysozyme